MGGQGLSLVPIQATSSISNGLRPQDLIPHRMMGGMLILIMAGSGLKVIESVSCSCINSVIQSGVVDYRFHGKGDASVRAEDSSGNIVEGACPITPPKKKQAKGGK